MKATSDIELLNLLRSAFALPKPGADFSTAGFLVRLKFRETTEEELRLLHETLRRAPPVAANATGLLIAQHLFVSCGLLLTWREVYREHAERYRLVGGCVAEMSRVMREEEVLGRPVS